VLYGLWNLSNVAPSAVGLEAAERQVSVLQLDGTVLVSPTNTPGTRVPPAIRENIEGQLSGSFETRAASGAEFLYGFSRLDDTGIDLDNPAVALRWVVLTRQPVETATAGANLVLGRLRAALFAAVFLALLVIAAVSRLVTRPLIRLTDTASELAQGNLSTPIPDLPKDEVGQLAEVLRQLVERLLYRVRQLNAAVQVSQATATTLDVEPMLRLVTRSLTEQFGIPEVRAFVLNADASRAQLMVGLGPESQRLARSGYSVKVDENTLPGRAMFTREEQYTGGFEAPAFAGSSREPAQLALPLQSGPDLYGVLHVIADEPGAFERQDINVLSLIADQVASSIKNARLLAQSQANLAEIETLNRRLTQEAWTEFLEEERSIRHTTDLADNWPNAPAQRETLVRSRDVVEAITYTAQDGRVVLSAPLLLRGEAIGVLAVTRPPGSSFTRDEVALLESVTSRMALIAEGIRLVEESNRRAAREQMISDVSARLFEQTDNVEAILQGALGELGAALGSQNVSLRLGEPPADEDRQLNPPDEEAHHENGAQQTEVNDDDTD
jgi:GAF domain-containing protein